jgi:hypothetical protein
MWYAAVLGRLWQQERVPIAELARRFELDRKTVRRFLICRRPGKEMLERCGHAEEHRDLDPQRGSHPEAGQAELRSAPSNSGEAPHRTRSVRARRELAVETPAVGHIEPASPSLTRDQKLVRRQIALRVELSCRDSNAPRAERGALSAYL